MTFITTFLLIIIVLNTKIIAEILFDIITYPVRYIVEQQKTKHEREKMNIFLKKRQKRRTN
jgi:hypothetical protein